MSRLLLAAGCAAVLGLAAWLSHADSRKPADEWKEVAPGVLRTAEQPFGYALIEDGHALLIDCPVPGDGLKAKGVVAIDQVLADAPPPRFDRGGPVVSRHKVPVRAAEGVGRMADAGRASRKYWKESLPLAQLADRVPRPAGRARRHRLLARRRPEDRLARLDDLRSSPRRAIRATISPSRPQGKDGARRLLRRRARVARQALGAVHDRLGPLDRRRPQADGRVAAQARRAEADASAARPRRRRSTKDVAPRPWTKTAEGRRGGRLPQELRALHQAAPGQRAAVPFLAKEQAASRTARSRGRKVSDHLWLTGNTYVLVSKDDKAFLVIDPWGQRSADQFAKLQEGPEARPARSRDVQPRPLRPLRRHLSAARPREVRRSGRSTRWPSRSPSRSGCGPRSSTPGR